MPVLTFWARRMQAAFFGGVRVSPDDRTREETPHAARARQLASSRSGSLSLADSSGSRQDPRDRSAVRFGSADASGIRGVRFARRPNTRRNAHAARARQLRHRGVVRCPWRALLARGPTKRVSPRRPNTRRNAHAARARQLRHRGVVRCPWRALLARGPTKRSFARKRGGVVRPRAREECLC